MASSRARDPDPEAQYTENIVLRQYLSSMPQLTTVIAKPSADETLEDALPERLKLLNGFPRTARFLAADPNKTLVIVRRFDDAAIRNLLLLEGRVAALEAVQKKLDEDDYAIYKTNDTLTKAASSWEHFALLGSFDTEDSKIPEAAFDLWCSSRIAVLEAKARENSEMPDQLKDKNYKEIEFILRRNQTLQKEIDKCDLQLRLISDPAQRPTSGHFEAEDWAQDRSRRLKLLESRQDLITERRYWLGYDEKEILEVKRRWEVSKALESALKDYQEAVLRYRDMLKLEEPADRSDDVLSRWVLGKFKTNAGTQKPSRQFLPGSAMDGVYQEGKQLKPNLLKCIFLTLLGRRQHLKTERHGTKPLVKDRVGVGRIASVDHLSRAISRFDFILKWGRVCSKEPPWLLTCASVN
jgi:hypothetical protein